MPSPKPHHTSHAVSYNPRSPKFTPGSCSRQRLPSLPQPRHQCAHHNGPDQEEDGGPHDRRRHQIHMRHLLLRHHRNCKSRRALGPHPSLLSLSRPGRHLVPEPRMARALLASSSSYLADDVNGRSAFAAPTTPVVTMTSALPASLKANPPANMIPPHTPSRSLNNTRSPSSLRIGVLMKSCSCWKVPKHTG